MWFTSKQTKSSTNSYNYLNVQQLLYIKKNDVHIVVIYGCCCVYTCMSFKNTKEYVCNTNLFFYQLRVFTRFLWTYNLKWLVTSFPLHMPSLLYFLICSFSFVMLQSHLYIIVVYMVYNKIIRSKNIQYYAHFEGIDVTIIMV